jgi:hypothetical protein
MTLENLRKKFNLKVFNKLVSSVANEIIDGYLNEAYQNYLLIAMDSMGCWQVNGNYAVANLIAGQRDYAFESTTLKIEAIYIKPTATGEYIKAEKIDVSQIPIDPEQYHPPIPQYDFVDGNLFVYLPNDIENVTAGIKVFLIEEFTDLVNTTDYPKIPKALQPYLWNYAANEHCENEEKWNKVKIFSNKLAVLENRIIDFYSDRAKTVIMQAKEENLY